MSKIYKFSGTLLSIAFLLLEVHGQASLPSLPLISSYSSEEYTAGMQNWALGISTEGMLYVGNNSGLLEYDGHEWRSTPVANGTKIRSLTIDQEGIIYAGAQGEFGYFERKNDGYLQYKSLAQLLPENFPVDETWSVFKIDSAIYYCTFRHVLKYENENIQVIDPLQPIGFSFNLNNLIYVHIPGKGLCLLQNDKSFELIPGGDFFSDYSVRALLPMNKNQFLVATHSDGVFLHEQGVITPWNSAANKALKTNLINFALRLSNGKIAIGTQNEGIYITTSEGNLLQTISEESGLADQTVNHLYEDEIGNLWASLHDGISYIEIGSPFGSLGSNLGISGSGYAAVNYKNNIYIGTNNYVYKSNEDQLDYRPIAGTEGQSYALQVFNDQVLLSHHNGIFSITGYDLQKLASVDGTWMCLRPQNHPDKLIAGHYTGLFLLEWNNNRWEMIKKYDGFNESCRVLAEDATNNLWMSHGYKGVYRIRFTEDLQEISKVDYYNQESGFPSNFLINVFEINGELIFAAETGIYHFNAASETFKLHPNLSEMFSPSSHIREMETDAMGNIYFISNQEAGVLKKTRLGSYKKDNAVFYQIMPFLNDALEKIEVIDNNTILFSAKQGFITYDPTIQYNLSNPGRPLIRFLQIISDTTQVVNASVAHLSSDTTFTFPYSKNSIRISYSSPVFGAGNQAMYRYQLENFDKNWSGWTSATNKEYTNLQEGKYTFKVQTRNVYGKISDTATFSIQILPPWFRSKLAYIFYFLSAGGGLFFLVTFMERKHKKEKRQLELDQQKALAKKDNKLDQLSRETQEEIARLRNEKLRAEVEHKNKELGNAAMRLISKNEFINHLKNSLNTLSKKSNNQSLKKDFSKLVSEIEKNIEGDNDWEQFQIHFDRVHGNFSERLKNNYPEITPQEMKMAAYLRMNLSSKDIAQLLNISVRGVEIARYRLRKKLNLDRQDNLSEFILKF
ncbi:MAG: ligand-binding sensor domain-containing protein [Cyclobacteriaceae bacterium]